MEENVITNILERLAAVEAQQANLLLMATVVKLHEDDDLLDIKVGDVVLEEIPYFTQRAGVGKTYWMPSEGESGMLLVPSGDLGNSVFMPGHNTKTNPPLEKDKNIVVRQWKPGYEERFDGNDNEHLLSIGGNVERKTESAKIEDKVGGSTRTTETAKIEDKTGTATLKITPAGIVISGPIANINGATFTNGTTNLLNSAGHVTYVPVLG